MSQPPTPPPTLAACAALLARALLPLAVQPATFAVCAAGSGIQDGSDAVSACSACACGSYSTGQGKACIACPTTAFNHHVGDTYVSVGMTFANNATGPETCVPRYAQLPAPAGNQLALNDAVFTAVPAGAASVAACIEACPNTMCCIAQYEAGSGGSPAVCKHAKLAPTGPVSADASIPRLFYKLPPSALIAAASVSAKTQSSSLYMSCNMSPWGALPGSGEIGTSPNPALVEEAKQTVEWDAAGCTDETSCGKSCDANAACWGYIYVQGKGFALRGGEDQIGTRSFFVSPEVCKFGIDEAMAVPPIVLPILPVLAPPSTPPTTPTPAPAPPPPATPTPAPESPATSCSVPVTEVTTAGNVTGTCSCCAAGGNATYCPGEMFQTITPCTRENKTGIICLPRTGLCSGTVNGPCAGTGQCQCFATKGGATCKASNMLNWPSELDINQLGDGGGCAENLCKAVASKQGLSASCCPLPCASGRK